MKKVYETAQIDIFMFEKKDAIVASAILPVDHDNIFVEISQLVDSFFET